MLREVTVLTWGQHSCFRVYTVLLPASLGAPASCETVNGGRETHELMESLEERWPIYICGEGPGDTLVGMMLNMRHSNPSLTPYSLVV